MQIMNPAQLGSTMKDQNGISSYPDGNERIAPVSNELKNKNGYRKDPELDVYADVDDFTSCNTEEAKDLVAASGVQTEMSYAADSTIYTDKNILESDLPELIVCYKDSIFHGVKDICVDEGMAGENKTENVVVGRSTLPSNNFKHTDVTEEADTNISYEDDFKSSSCKDFKENVAADGVNKGEVNLDKNTSYDSDSVELESSPESDKYQDFASVQIPKSLVQQGEEECNAIKKTTEIVCDSTLLGKNLHSETSLECLLKSARCGENNSSQQSDQISGAQAQSPVMTEESNTSSLDSLIDSRVISFNVESSKLAPNTRDDIHENTIRQQLKSEKKLIHDDGISDNRLVTNNQIKRDQGESSFSVAGSLPDGVPYSGHIPFSGSISLRSDSSTTSTRSFAFPVLPNEWNSSPVRMAKGDRRNLRRRRGCNLGLLCCRF